MELSTDLGQRAFTRGSSGTINLMKGIIEGIQVHK